MNRLIAIDTTNNVCVHCLNPLEEERLMTNQGVLRIEYRCNKCGTRYRLNHIETDFSIIKPLYDEYLVLSFMESFGEPIQNRRNRILSNLGQSG